MYDLNLAMRIKNKVEKHVIRIKTYHIQQITHEKISQFRFAESRAIGLKMNKFGLSQGKFVLPHFGDSAP